MKLFYGIMTLSIDENVDIIYFQTINQPEILLSLVVCLTSSAFVLTPCFHPTVCRWLVK